MNMIITIDIEENLTVDQIDQLRFELMEAVENVTSATYGLQIPVATW